MTALMAVNAKRRALVISARDQIDVRNGRSGLWNFPAVTDASGRKIEWVDPGGDYIGVDLVIVRGSTGPSSWPMHPSWVRRIRDDCAKANVAFIFTGWGEWCPTATPRLLDQSIVDGSDRRIVHVNGAIMSATAREIIEIQDPWWGAERVGAKQSGRHLDGVEHIALPEVL